VKSVDDAGSSASVDFDEGQMAERIERARERRPARRLDEDEGDVERIRRQHRRARGFDVAQQREWIVSRRRSRLSRATVDGRRGVDSVDARAPTRREEHADDAARLAAPRVDDLAKPALDGSRVDVSERLIEDVDDAVGASVRRGATRRVRRGAARIEKPSARARAGARASPPSSSPSERSSAHDITPKSIPIVRVARQSSLASAFAHPRRRRDSAKNRRTSAVFPHPLAPAVANVATAPTALASDAQNALSASRAVVGSRASARARRTRRA
jgi:hypothetical protein